MKLFFFVIWVSWLCHPISPVTAYGILYYKNNFSHDDLPVAREREEWLNCHRNSITTQLKEITLKYWNLWSLSRFNQVIMKEIDVVSFLDTLTKWYVNFLYVQQHK